MWIYFLKPAESQQFLLNHSSSMFVELTTDLIWYISGAYGDHDDDGYDDDVHDGDGFLQ